MPALSQPHCRDMPVTRVRGIQVRYQIGSRLDALYRPARRRINAHRFTPSFDWLGNWAAPFTCEFAEGELNVEVRLPACKRSFMAISRSLDENDYRLFLDARRVDVV